MTAPAADADRPLADTRFRGYRSCVQCDWQVTMTGDTAADVDAFLERAVNEHVVERHGGIGVLRPEPPR